VQAATGRQHPDGRSIGSDVPESKFEPTFDLTAPAETVDAHTTAVTDPTDLESALRSAATAVDNGTTAVVDVRLESV